MLASKVSMQKSFCWNCLSEPTSNTCWRIVFVFVFVFVFERASLLYLLQDCIALPSQLQLENVAKAIVGKKTLQFKIWTFQIIGEKKSKYKHFKKLENINIQTKNILKSASHKFWGWRALDKLLIVIAEIQSNPIPSTYSFWVFKPIYIYRQQNHLRQSVAVYDIHLPLSVGGPVLVSDFGDSCRIYRACELVANELLWKCSPSLERAVD